MRIAVVAIFCFVSQLAPAQAQDMFGAIAFSQQSGAHGYSYDYTSRARAENVAIANCARYGGGCQIVIWFRNACGAVAVGARRGYGTGWANDASRAQQIAISNCRARDDGCRILRWQCTSR